MQTQIITYEYPLNEIIRACLRLEQLFHKIDHQLNDKSILGTQQAIHSLIDILQLLERPDLKSKLAKELNHSLTALMRYGELPQIDSQKLEKLIQQLEEHMHHLIESNGRIGHHLRDIELLNTLRLHLCNPGGGCNFDTPIYHYWLQQSPETHRATIQEWLASFSQIRAAISLLLSIVRQHAKIEEKTAIHGFYQELLDPQSHLRLIRIGIPQQVQAFPEISVGRHFLSARFYEPDIMKRPSQYTGDVLFSLVYCH
jgi:cell division protein ZapD